MPRSREIGPPSCAKLLCSEVAEEDVAAHAARFKHARQLTNMWSKGVEQRRKKDEAAREIKLQAGRDEKKRLMQERKEATEARLKATRDHISNEKTNHNSWAQERQSSFEATLPGKAKERKAHLQFLDSVKQDRIKKATRSVKVLRTKQIDGLTTSIKSFGSEKRKQIDDEKRRREALRTEGIQIISVQDTEYYAEVLETKKKFESARQKARAGYMQHLESANKSIKADVRRRSEELHTAKQIRADDLAARQKEHNDTLLATEEKRLRDEAKAAKRAQADRERIAEVDTWNLTHRAEQEAQAVRDAASVKEGNRTEHAAALAAIAAKQALVLPALKHLTAKQKADYESARRERQDAQQMRQALEEETYASIVAREFRLPRHLVSP